MEYIVAISNYTKKIVFEKSRVRANLRTPQLILGA